MGRAQPCENAEGKVKRAHKDAGGETHGTGRDAEVGDEPECSRCEVRSEVGDKSFDIRLREAIEEEVGHDEIVSAGGREGEGAGMARLQASGGSATLAEKVEHSGAGVYGFGVEIGVGSHQCAEEAAVPIAQNARSSLIEKKGKEVQAAVFQGAAQREVFEPAIGAGDCVEVGFNVHR